MKGYISAVPTSFFSLQRLSAFASEEDLLNVTICRAQSDVFLVSMKQGVVFPQNSGVSIQRWSGDYFKIFGRII